MAITTTAELAVDLGADEADIALVLARLAEDDPDLTGEELPDYAADFLRQLLDLHAPAASDPLRPEATGGTTRHCSCLQGLDYRHIVTSDIFSLTLPW